MPRHGNNALRRGKQYSMNTSASQSSEHSPDSDYEGPFDKEQDRELQKYRKRKFELEVASDSSESLCSEDYEYLSADLCSDDLECCSETVVEKQSKKLRKKKRREKRYKVGEGGDGDDEGCSSLGVKQSQGKKMKRSGTRDKARSLLDASKKRGKRCRNAAKDESNDQGCRSSDVRDVRDSREADAPTKAESRFGMVDASTQVEISPHDKERPCMKDACTQVQAPLSMHEKRRPITTAEGSMEVWDRDSIFGPCKRKQMYRDDAHAGPSLVVEPEHAQGDRSEADAGRSEAKAEQAELEQGRIAEENKASASEKELGVKEGEGEQDEFGGDLQQNTASESASENESGASVPTPSTTKNSAAKYFGGPVGYNSKGMMRTKSVKNKTASANEGKLSMKQVLVCKRCYDIAKNNDFEAGTNPLVVVEDMIQREEGEQKKVFARPRDLRRHYTNFHNSLISPDITRCYLKQLIHNYLNSEASEENYRRMQMQEETTSTSVQLHAFWCRDEGANREKYNLIANTVKPLTPTPKRTLRKEENDDDDMEGFVVHDDGVSGVEYASQYVYKYVDRRVEFDGVQGVVQRFHAKRGVFSVQIGGETVQWSLQDIKARLVRKQRAGPPRIAVLMDLEREKRKIAASRGRVFQAEDSPSDVGAEAGTAQRDIAPAARASDKDPASDLGAGGQDVDSTATWSDSD